jgi:hypothetical protein
MHIEADKLRTDLRRLRAQLVRATDKQTRMALAKAYRKRKASASSRGSDGKSVGAGERCAVQCNVKSITPCGPVVRLHISNSRPPGMFRRPGGG